MIPHCNSATLSQGSHHPLFISMKRRVEKVCIQNANTLHCNATRQISTITDWEPAYQLLVCVFLQAVDD